VIDKICIVKESYCGDEFSIHKVFSTKEKAEKYLKDKSEAECEECKGTGVVYYEYIDDEGMCSECYVGTGRGYNDDVFYYVTSEHEVL